MDLTYNETHAPKQRIGDQYERTGWNVWYCTECELAWENACRPITHYRKGFEFGLRLEHKTCPECLGKPQPYVYSDIKPGTKFNDWTIIKFARRDGYKQFYLCKCKCGTVKECLKWHLTEGRSKDCAHCKSLRYKK